MATNLEDRLLSAVLKDAQIHVLLQADATKLFRTHGDVWEFVRKYYEQNQVVPTVSLVKERFIDFEPQIEVGATKHHLDELRADYLRDNLRNTLRTAATSVQEGETVEALDKLIADAAELKRVTSEVRDLDVSDIDNALDYFEQLRILNESGSHGIRTGLPGFDNYLPAGITPGQLGVILAYPAIGKSWFVVYMAAQAWAQGRSPLIISMEMTEQEVRNRFFTVLGAGMWRHRKLSRGEVELDQMKSWMEKTFAGKPPIHIISNEGIGEINPAVVRGKIDQHSPDIVFLDYLNLMTSNTKADSEVVKMKNLSRELKLLALSSAVPIVAISSATPDDVTRMDVAPTLGQTSWSRQIAYDADWLLSLGRAANSDTLEAVFRKNRNGFLGEFMLTVDFDMGSFIYKDFEDDDL